MEESGYEGYRGWSRPAPHAVNGGAHRAVVGISHSEQVTDEVGAR
jgi:hypothetical protein